MLARKKLSEEFREFNRRWGAPHGRRLRGVPQRFVRPIERVLPRIRGPFGYQINNSTRRVEFPWAFHAVPIGPGVTVIDLGGSLAGFQFVLDRSGARVLNVDPGEESHGLGWPVTIDSVERLNRLFRTNVTLIPEFLHDAGIESESIDVVYSISTIEHIPPQELEVVSSEIARVLRPGGRAVLTIDLFLNLAPFTRRLTNEYGTNIDVREFVENSGLRLIAGDTCELHGYPEFDPLAILARLEEYEIGSYPALAQLCVLRKDP